MFFAVERWLFVRYCNQFSAAQLEDGRLLVMDDANKSHVVIEVFENLRAFLDDATHPNDVVEKIAKKLAQKARAGAL